LNSATLRIAGVATLRIRFSTALAMTHPFA
jgi:hypothetical protein